MRRYLPASYLTAYIPEIRSERPQWVLAACLYFLLICRVLDLSGARLSLFPQFPDPAVSTQIAARFATDATLSPQFFGGTPPIWSEGGRALRDGVDIAIATMVLEAAGEGFDGMVAVAEVIRNRAAEARENYGEVCLAPYQFSCWNDAARAREFLAKHRDVFETAFRAWLASAGSNLTRGATFYHADYVSPSWATGFTRSARVGRHLFYRPD